MIPKLIHIIMLGANRPDWALANIDRFRAINPGWEVVVHEAPFEMADEYVAAYANAFTVGEQADVMRFAVLDAWGGWYFDWDTYAIKPLDDMKSTEMLGGRLLLAPSNSGPASLAYALASEPEIPAFETVRALMADIAENGAPNGTTYERALCEGLLDRCPDKVCVGLHAEFGQGGPTKHANIAYECLQKGAWANGTGDAYFLHGWKGLSHLPPVQT